MIGSKGLSEESIGCANAAEGIRRAGGNGKPSVFKESLKKRKSMDHFRLGLETSGG